jgi:hypothetical protein
MIMLDGVSKSCESSLGFNVSEHAIGTYTVSDEKHRYCDLILVAHEPKVVLHSVQASITNCSCSSRQ